MTMRRARWFLLILFLGSSIAAAQEIANWVAPLFWQPPARASAAGRSGEEQIRGTFAATSPLPFIAITPCRVVDTRGLGQPAGFGTPTMAADEVRNFLIPSHPVCTGIPANAGAYSLNITVTNTGPSPYGYIKVWATTSSEPNVSTLNWSSAGVTVANAAIVPAGVAGAITVRSGNASTDLIIDINGYYSNPRGSDNTALGNLALFQNTTGLDNTAIGSLALLNAIAANDNTAIGAFALRDTTGSGNTALGTNAGALTTSATNNILIGKFAGNNITTGSSNILIGSAGSQNESNTIRIGDPANQTSAIMAGIAGATAPGGVPVLISGGGRLGTTTSSRRFKREIRDIGPDSDRLMKLRPVAFRYLEEIDPTNLLQYGLIAEEVAEVYPDLVAHGRDGRPEAIRYQEMNALLLNEIQKQRATIDRLQSRLAEIEKRLAPPEKN